MVTGRGWFNLIVGILLLGQSVLPYFGISFLQFGSISQWVVIAGLILIIIDGFTEDGGMKTATLIIALVLAIFVAVPMANSAGWIPFSIPGAVIGIYPWVLALTALFLIVGAFKRGY